MPTHHFFSAVPSSAAVITGLRAPCRPQARRGGGGGGSGIHAIPSRMGASGAAGGVEPHGRSGRAAEPGHDGRPDPQEATGAMRLRPRRPSGRLCMRSITHRTGERRGGGGGMGARSVAAGGRRHLTSPAGPHRRVAHGVSLPMTLAACKEVRAAAHHARVVARALHGSVLHGALRPCVIARHRKRLSPACRPAERHRHQHYRR